MFQKLFKKNHKTSGWDIQIWLLLSCVFSCLILGTRIIITGHSTYLFLLWNLFLAFIPYAIAQWLYTHNRVAKNKLQLIILVLLWLSFVPNSFYIITDLFHLAHFDSAPKWFDLMLLFSFAWNGLLFGMVSISKTESLLERFAGKKFSLPLIFVVMWLNAFGMYLGRYLRYNSWDLIMQPFPLFNDILELMFHPLANKMEWGMIMIYAVFMTLLYITFKKLGASFSEHLSLNLKSK